MKQRFRAWRKWYDSITLREQARPSPKQLFLHQEAAPADGELMERISWL
jgi:hypothetical protein